MSVATSPRQASSIQCKNKNLSAAESGLICFGKEKKRVTILSNKTFQNLFIKFMIGRKSPKRNMHTIKM